MKKYVLLLALLLTGCSQAAAPSSTLPVHPTSESLPVSESVSQPEEETTMKIQVQVGGQVFAATLADTEAAAVLAQMLAQAPVTVSLRDYGSFEKVGPLGAELPATDSHTTTAPGDIVLYQGDQIVLFYGSNAWSYTRLARIDDLTGWQDALDSGSVDVTFSLEDA